MANEQINTLQPSQHSMTLLGGALYRAHDGMWRWSHDGAVAQHVRDMRLGALLPRFRTTRRYGRTHYTIPVPWREVYRWQGDALAGAHVDTLVQHGEQSLVGGELELVDGMGARRNRRLPGALVTMEDWDAMADVPIPSWCVKDAVHVFARAQAPTLFLDDEDMQREVDLVRRRFFTPEAKLRFAGCECQACEAWLTITVELRSLWRAGGNRFQLWECEHALGKAWDALPDKFWCMAKTYLWAWAQQFGPRGGLA